MKKILFFSFLSFFSFQKENYAIKIEGFEKDQRHVVLREVESKKAVFNQWTHSGAVILDPNQYAEGLYEFASAAPSSDYVPNFLAYIHPKLPEGIAIITTESNALVVNTFKDVPPIYMCLVSQNDQKEKIEQGYTYGMGLFKNLKYEDYFLYLSGPQLSLKIPVHVPHQVKVGIKKGQRLVIIKNELTNEVIYKGWHTNGTVVFDPAKHYFKPGIYKIETAESGKNFELDSLLFIDPRLPAGVVHGRIEANTLEINTFFADKNLKAYLKPAHNIQDTLNPLHYYYEIIFFNHVDFQNYFLYFENKNGMIAEIPIFNPEGHADGDLFIDDIDEEDNDILFQFPPKQIVIKKENPKQNIPQNIPLFKEPIPVDNGPDPLLKQKMIEGNYAGDFETKAAKASIENLYKIVKPYDGRKALREITEYIHQLKKHPVEKDKFKRFNNYRQVIADELDNALHALSGPAEFWPNFEGNEYWNILNDGTAVYALDLLGRVWNAILTHQMSEEERSMMKKTLVSRLGYCVEDPWMAGQQGQRICIKGKVKHLLLALQGHIPGIMIDRPDPKTFVPNFIQRLADKTKENEDLHYFLWYDCDEKGDLKKADVEQFIQEARIEFNKSVNEVFGNHEQDLRIMVQKHFNEEFEGALVKKWEEAFDPKKENN